MSDFPFDPPAARPPTRVVRTWIDRVPGQRDMSHFEHVFAGPSADGPRLQWVVRRPDGRVVVTDSEDHALAVARRFPGCRVARRYVTACVAR
jgi:hypothetical protein